MCVIIVVEEDAARPSADQIQAMWDTNESGAGIAWRDGAKVRFKKGILSVEEIKKLIASTPVPFVAHFRIPTCGYGEKSLTHPFPVEKSAPLMLAGSTTGGVLFHNGHWSKWKEVMLETAARGHHKLPEGKWSDTRAMAWCAAIYGPTFCELVEEKVVYFSPNDLHIYGTDRKGSHGWSLVGEKGKEFLASNTLWEHRVRRVVNTGGSYHTSSPQSLPGATRGQEQPSGMAGSTEGKNTASGTEQAGGPGAVSPFPRVTQADLESAFRLGRVGKKKYRRLLSRLAAGKTIALPRSSPTPMLSSGHAD